MSVEDMHARFSILMPAYNAEATLDRAVKSVLAQTFSNWELIIVNDGSTDRTREIAERYAQAVEVNSVSGMSVEHHHIRVITQQNSGCGAARATAARAALAPYCVRFDADDELMPNYLQAMNDVIETHPNHDIYCCNGIHRSESGHKGQLVTKRQWPARPGKRYNHEQTFTFEDLMQANHIFTMAIFTRTLFKRVGIDEDVYCEDYDFWVRSLTDGQTTCFYTPQTLAYYTVTDTQMTADASKVFASRLEIYNRLIYGSTVVPQTTAPSTQPIDPSLSSTSVSQPLNVLSDPQYQAVLAAIQRTKNEAHIYAKRTALLNSLAGTKDTGWRRAVSAVIHLVSKLLRPAYARALVRRRNF